MTDRCHHCPLDRSLVCRGIVTRRLCELVDPHGGVYHPEYVSVLEFKEEGDLVPTPMDMQPIKGGCCDGPSYPED